MADEVKRLNYFDKQFLHEQDFNDEQTYHIRLQRDHSRLLHAPGIAEGLEIPDPTVVPPDAAVPPTSVTVSPGVAYDARGRRIVLADDRTDRTLDLAGQPPGQDVYITVSYGETQTDSSDEGGKSGNTRWTEAAEIGVSASFPTNPTVTLVLARIERSGTDVSGVDTSGRLAAGDKGDVAGDLRVGGNLIVAGTIQGDIAVGTVEAGDLAEGAVTTAAIAAGAVTESEVADDAIASAKIAEAVDPPVPGRMAQDTNSGTGIKTGHLQNRAVTTAKLDDGAVTAAKIAEGSVGTVQLGGSAVTAENIADDAITSAKIAEAVETPILLPPGGLIPIPGGPIRIPDTTTPIPGTSQQDTNSGTGIKTGHLQNRAVTAAKLADGAVTAAKLADNAVTASKVAGGNIGSGELADGAVTAGKIADGAVVGGKLADNLEIPGRVGIGLSPGFPLDVLGRMRVRQTAAGQETAGIWLSGYYRRELDSAFIGMEDEGTVGFFGNVGDSGWRLRVTLDRGDLTIAGNAFKPGGGAWGTSSDERLKQEVRPLDDALERLLQLDPVSFEWKEPAQQGNLTGPQMGFLARDVEAVFPEWVGVDPRGYKTLTIRGFEALAVEAIKQLKAENEGLREQLAQMEQRIEALERRRRLA